MIRNKLGLATYLIGFLGEILSDVIDYDNSRCIANKCICTQSNPVRVTCTAQFVNPSPFLFETDQLAELPNQYSFYIHLNNFPVIERIVSENKSLEVLILALGRNQINTLGDRIFDNIHGLRELKLSINNLASLSFLRNKMVSNLTLLDASKNKLTEFKPEWVEFMGSLQELRLDNNKIKSLESGIFDRMVDLVTITLNSNELVVIPGYLFNGLNKLEYLNLEENFLVKIEGLAFKGCESLKLNDVKSYVLSFTSQSIEKLEPFSFADLKQVIDLNLQKNNLNDIENKTFFGMKLLSLRLDDNYIGLIDIDAFDSTMSNSLLLLNLSDNSLAQLNRYTFTNLKSLIYLYLDTNTIVKIEPYSFENQASTLQILDLHSNKIGSIREHHLSYLIALIKLNLSSNQISSIEIRSFIQMKGLLELDLSNNCIFNIHSDLFIGLTSLTFLSLSDNLLQDLKPTTFNRQTNLLTLDLSYNSLREIPSSLFSYLKKLKTLYLNNNQLSWLNNSKSFAGLSSLITLKLSGNMIRQLTTSSFTGISLGVLKSLYLDNNLIDSTQSSRIPFNSLSLLDLSSNPFIKSSSILPTSYSSALELTLKNMTVEFVRDFFSKKIPSVITKLDLSFNNFREVNIDVNKFDLNKLESLIIKSSHYNISTSLFLGGGYMFELDLSDNPYLVYAPNFQIKSTFLSKLILSNTGLQNVEILKLEGFYRLSTLDLSKNKLEVMKSTFFSKLFQLKFLNLSSNGIRLIEPRFVGSSYLQVIDLSNNNIQYIKSELINFYTIGDPVSIYYSNNRITNFGHNSSYIERIDLSKNELDTIPDDIKRSDMFKQASEQCLRFINLTLNKISSLMNDSFTDKKYLEHIYLGSNRIAFIEDFTFTRLIKLETLDLSNNSIFEVNSNTFVGLVRLEYLDLSMNLIEYLPQNTFLPVKNLYKLDLNYNKIKQIPDGLFSPLSHLNLIYLSQIGMKLISRATFRGLSSLSRMEISKILLNNPANVNALIESLMPKYAYLSNHIYWYYAVYIYYSEGVEYSDRYCSLMIYFARYNLLFNMEIDEYMQYCRHKEIVNLDYHKFGLL